MDNSCVKNYTDSTWRYRVMSRTWIFGMCVLWPWPWEYDLGTRSWHTLGSWTILWDIIQIQNCNKELCPDTDFGYVTVHCDLNLGDMTLGQGHDTPFDHGQQLCEILSRSFMAVGVIRHRFWHVCTVTLEIWPLVKVMTHPWAMEVENSCLKYITQIGQRSKKLWPGYDVTDIIIPP